MIKSILGVVSLGWWGKEGRRRGRGCETGVAFGALWIFLVGLEANVGGREDSVE